MIGVEQHGSKASGKDPPAGRENYGSWCMTRIVHQPWTAGQGVGFTREGVQAPALDRLSGLGG